jgi:16S rRNA (cytidine1402-2'-O)-methyltransferase
MPLSLLTNDAVDKNGRGQLYIVATPIGNMDDITLRALHVLEAVDHVAAEDTRRTGRLLAHYKIKSPLISYHEHNERERTPGLIKKLKAGLSVALVSNAGTPLVSDPGFHLIQEAITNGIRVTPVPGANAAVTALSVSGLPTDSFTFIGFPARKKTKRHGQLKKLADEPRTIIFYESPKRIKTLLDEIILIVGDRYGVLSREMTKRNEEFIRGFLTEILHNLNQRSMIKGECTLLVMGCGEDETLSQETIRAEVKRYLETTKTSLTELVKEIATKYDLPRNKVYEEALKIKTEYNGRMINES